jgi:replication-associated recombination protein RarA
MKPWDELDEANKNSNRNQALQIPEKLQKIHYDFLPAVGEVQDFQFSPDEIEILAEMEHDRWMNERLAEDWKQDYDIEESNHERN